MSDFDSIFSNNTLLTFTITDLFDQTGRVAVITGGNRGIGADVVEKLLHCNISVVMGEYRKLNAIFCAQS